MSVKDFAPVFGWYFAPWIRIRGSSYFSGSRPGSGSRKPICCGSNGSGSQAPCFNKKRISQLILHKKVDFLIIWFSCFVWLWTHEETKEKIIIFYNFFVLNILNFSIHNLQSCILVYTISNPVGNSKAPAILHKWNSQSYTVENQVKRWK